MIQIRTDTPEFFSDLGDMLRLFYGDVTISLTEGDPVFEHHFSEENGCWVDRWQTGDHHKELSSPIVSGTTVEIKRLRKRQVKQCLYLLLKDMTDLRLPWGSLTGIRPTRLLYEAMEAGMDLSAARQHVIDAFDVSEDRATLLCEIAQMQEGIRYPEANAFDLYIGIPFCRTRCSYCSFSAGEIGNGKLVEPYVNTLLQEIELSQALMAEKGLHLRAGYIGGGTPTAIPCNALERILDKAQKAFPGAIEWTVEAGRPDTIDLEKLKMLKDHGVGRISVNPQTFSDETLKRIGRGHTASDTLRAYEQARSLGFDDINMDIIAALPGETVEDFEHTLTMLEKLRPESVTVHSLAIKRSSRLHEQLHVNVGQHTQITAEGAAEMIASARKRLTDYGWKPYYLYRQKYMAGNLENVGYALPGKACLYNIGNMEETASVLALGAGAISKWLFDRDLRIERAPNVRNIEEYIRRVDEMVQRKRDVIFSPEVKA